MLSVRLPITWKLSADAQSEAGPAEVAAGTDTATAGVQPLETVLTGEVVGKLEPEDTTPAQQLQEIMRESSQLLRGMTTLRERQRENVSPDFTII